MAFTRKPANLIRNICLKITLLKITTTSPRYQWACSEIVVGTVWRFLAKFLCITTTCHRDQWLSYIKSTTFNRPHQWLFIQHKIMIIVYLHFCLGVRCLLFISSPSHCFVDKHGVPWELKDINSLRARQNDRRFADDTFKRIFLNENVRISIKISLKFVPKDPINNNPALVQIMAWRRSGDKPLSEAMMVSLLTHRCVTRPQWVKDTPVGFGNKLGRV